MTPDREVPAVLPAFRIPGEVEAVERWGAGHIHDSWRVTTREKGRRETFLLQRLNHAVFADPAGVTESVRRVTEHLEARLRARGAEDVARRVLRLVETRDQGVCHEHADGTWWRAYAFVEGARSFETATGPEMVRAAAHAFGAFHRDLIDLPPPRLPETIPHFHDTPRRFAAFEEAVAEDRLDRAREARFEIHFLREREDTVHVLEDARRAGEIPERVVHNDAKLDNVLFDEATGEALCVVDLDTVMPGLALYDLGDLIRTSTSGTAEDERDLARIHAEPRRFEAVVAGYLDAMADHLNERERALIALSGRLITLELALRFLADHLQGDAYFRVQRPGQNLDRARAQLALVRSLEAQDEAFTQIAARAARAQRGTRR